MSRKNIKVPEPLFNALRDDKDDNQSWPHYLESECLHDASARHLRDQLDRVEHTLADVANEADTVDARIVDMDATERQRLAEAIAEVLGP